MAYGKVEDGFWNDRLIRALPELTRYFMLYLLTCSHRNRLGCYVLDPFYAAADLKWTAEQVAAQLDTLVQRDRIGWDPDNRVVLVKRFLKHNTMENQNVVKGSIVDLRSLPPTPLLPELLELVEKYKRPHYHLIIEALRNRLANDYPNDSETITQTNGTGPGLTGPSLTRPLESKTSSLPPDTGGHDFSTFRNQDHDVILQIWHLGNETVTINGEQISMALEMHIRRELCRKYDEETVSGALPFIRQAEPDIPADEPISLRLPESRPEVMNRCIGLWHKSTLTEGVA